MKIRNPIFPANANSFKLENLAFTLESTYSNHDRVRDPVKNSKKFQSTNSYYNIIEEFGRLICNDWSCSICRVHEKFEPKKPKLES